VTKRSSEALLWLGRADEDIPAAEVLLRDPNLVSSAAFHSQQAAEKMAKAVLISFGGDSPKIHDVAKLGTLIRPQRADIGEILAALGGLTDWYITARYPGDTAFAPSSEEVTSVLTKVKDLHRLVGALVTKPR
jgi:HEPN domain-containing protein